MNTVAKVATLAGFNGEKNKTKHPYSLQLQGRRGVRNCWPVSHDHAVTMVTPRLLAAWRLKTQL